jgi:hypothetical protein
MKLKRDRVSLRVESNLLKDAKALAERRAVTLTSLFEAGLNLVLAKAAPEGKQER